MTPPWPPTSSPSIRAPPAPRARPRPPLERRGRRRTRSSGRSSRSRAGWSTTSRRSGARRSARVQQGAPRGGAPRRATSRAIGITNQRETTALWDRATGQAAPPRHRLAGPAHRRRRAPSSSAAGHEPRVREKTGLVLDPVLLRRRSSRGCSSNVKGAREQAEPGELAFGTIDTFLVYRLTGGTRARHRRLQRQPHAADGPPHAARGTGSCSSSSASPPRVPAGDPRRRAEVYGDDAGLKVAPRRHPHRGHGGDQQAALFGQACFAPGEAKCTYGTGRVPADEHRAEPVASTRGLLTTVAWQLGDEVTYALEGIAFIAGAAVQWLRDGLGLIKKAAGGRGAGADGEGHGRGRLRPGARRPGRAALAAGGARPLHAASTAPPRAAHLARAVLEGIALQIHDLAEAMRHDAGQPVPVFKVDGGASRQRPPDAVPGGPARRAGGAAATCRDHRARRGVPRRPRRGRLEGARRRSGKAWKVGKRFEPKMKPTEREAHLAKWRKAIQAA